MKNMKHNGQRLLIFFAIFCLGVVLSGMPVFAAVSSGTTSGNDPLKVVNNLSDFIFGIVRAIGMILTGFGVMQVGLSFKSHDASQRAQGFLSVVGGVIIMFSKEILTLITG